VQRDLCCGMSTVTRAKEVRWRTLPRPVTIPSLLARLFVSCQYWLAMRSGQSTHLDNYREYAGQQDDEEKLVSISRTGLEIHAPIALAAASELTLCCNGEERERTGSKYATAQTMPTPVWRTMWFHTVLRANAALRGTDVDGALSCMGG
jgi:hypothetical protein